MQQTTSGDTAIAARLAEIRDIAADLFSVEPEEVEAAESFVNDLDADSLLAIELLSQLEKLYDIHIPEGDVPRMVNLRATYELVAEIAGW
ncbi:acyl carrier protein [Streptomyces sp. APSN-46.1]|uniref:acyl carrier protein n=1 Tax=Streptomyces sp. APSN-46.1 TaxID=2929049 RepID=UPI001FB24335|nr:acyl carrier protein [Streptomyces sp. APSN-46.1]MCJ1678500.1 acyl carrier protein [Streptomyces sp. APSN-46.1]